MATKKINLNDYELVKTQDELEGYNAIMLIPFMLNDGTQPPALFLRKGKAKDPLVSDVTDVEWEPGICISNKGSYKEYADLVDWWFNSALENEEYKSDLNHVFNRNGFDIKYNWNACSNWLKNQVGSARKTSINLFVRNWLRRGMDKHMSGRKRY